MKKTIITSVIFALSAVTFSVNAAKPDQAAQLIVEQQKTQLRPQEFNFYSDRYKQVLAHKANVAQNGKSFKQQLAEQKTLLRPQEFNFYSDRYKQVHANDVVVTTTEIAALATFQDQLDSQKQQLRPQEFNFFSDRYKQISTH